MKDMIDDGSALVIDRIFTVYFNMIQWQSFTFSSSIALKKKKLTRKNDTCVRILF
jgi:hypothetical protein